MSATLSDFTISEIRRVLQSVEEYDNDGIDEIQADVRKLRLHLAEEIAGPIEPKNTPLWALRFMAATSWACVRSSIETTPFGAERPGIDTWEKGMLLLDVHVPTIHGRKPEAQIYRADKRGTQHVIPILSPNQFREVLEYWEGVLNEEKK